MFNWSCKCKFLIGIVKQFCSGKAKIKKKNKKISCLENLI